MMKADQDRSTRFAWPPFIVAMVLVVGTLLNRFLPFPNITAQGRWPEIIGAVFIACGVGSVLWATKTLRNAGTTIRPYRKSRHLVSKGPYALSRNPIYLGYVLLIAGLGIALGSIWLVILAVVAGYLIRKLAIEQEERHLRAVFGADFEMYRQHTRRWL